MNTATENPIQVADRLFQAMELLAKNPPMGLMELSNNLDLNKSTMHRILNSLIFMGYAKQEMPSGKYTLTQKICELSNQFSHQTDTLSLVRPILEELAHLSRETIHFVEIEKNSVTYLDIIESPRNLVPSTDKVGDSIPLYCTGVGKALLAGMPDDIIKNMWQNGDLESYTPNTIVNYFDFLEEIERIRKNGYALDLEEYETGVRCVAVSLQTTTKYPKYALSISAPTRRMDKWRISEFSNYILEAQEKLKQELS